MNNRIYDNVLFNNCGEPLCIEKIYDFQKNKNITLPDDYINFLCTINGGEPVPSSIYLQTQIDDKSESFEQFEVRELYGLTHIGNANINLENLCQNLFFPPISDSRSFFMIGDVDSNYLYIATCKEYFGNVFLGSYPFGYQEDTYPHSNQNYNDLVLENIFHIYEEDRIASSFSTFLEMLSLPTIFE